jgi:hypothetical protein
MYESINFLHECCLFKFSFNNNHIMLYNSLKQLFSIQVPIAPTLLAATISILAILYAYI